MRPGGAPGWFARVREVLRSDDDPTPRERLDDRPDAASRAGVAIVLATVVLFSLLSVVAGGFVDLPLAGLAPLGVLCMLAVAAGSPAARHVSLLCLFTAAAYRMRGFGPHPFPLVSALVGYGVVVMITPTLRGRPGARGVRIAMREAPAARQTTQSIRMHAAPCKFKQVGNVKKKKRADDRRIGVRCSEATSDERDFRVSGNMPLSANRATVIHPVNQPVEHRNQYDPTSHGCHRREFEL
jgi:hypothetical protein